MNHITVSAGDKRSKGDHLKFEGLIKLSKLMAAMFRLKANL